ncbi:MAG: amidohydrolase family protein [Pseudodesulfovibrio sp.]|nr:amidohydrolase family protein [Pseudodesulfovibrio sp.]
MSISRREFLASMTGLALLASPTGPARGSVLPSERYALVGNVLPGNRTPPLKNHAVLVDKGHIEAIVPASKVTDRPIVAPSNATILPGIINAHCHRMHSPEERSQRWLRHGVTAIGDTASPLTAMPLLADSPPGTTATAAMAGPMLTPPGGYPLPVHSPEHAMIIRSAKEGRDAVMRLSDLGAGMIKISFEPGPMPKAWPCFDPVTAASICSEARKKGLVIRCHVEDLSGLEPALDAGVHTVEHVPHRWNTGQELRSVLHRTNGKVEPIPYYQSLLERMAHDSVILTPTLDVLSRSVWNGPELHEPVRAYAAMGGRLALGNDFPYRRTEAGMPLREMNLLAMSGISNNEILESATAISAMACGFTDRGVLAPGMTADILMVKGDPLMNLGVLSDPIHIIKDGVFVW